MKTLLAICISLFLFSSCNSQPDTKHAISDSLNNGFALIELFTSQGCSSCPPADVLLGKEINAAAKSGNKLIALSFHVDYWNRLGWTDPFSQHAFTQRQYGYSARLKGDGVYTPQAIINGQQAFVGSKQASIDDYIKQAFKEKPVATIHITSIEVKSGNLEIKYQYTGAAANLNIAIVQHQVSTPVKAGENDGRTLTNYNVVRSWKTIDIKTGNELVEIEKPVGYDAGSYSIILFAQEKEFGKVLAAVIQ